jgi:4'-phosphopantetheinyl transferase EntD
MPRYTRNCLQVSLKEWRGKSKLPHCAPSNTNISWDCVLLSAKESIYKALFPLTEKWLNFEDATVVFDQRHRTFQARLFTGATINGRSIDLLGGCFNIACGFVFTFVRITVDAGAKTRTVS